jgi:hypothetical protein
MLGTLVAERGGEPAESSGIWGMWIRAVEAAAQLFGVAAALKALKEGEEQGISDYQDGLNDSSLDAESRQALQTQLQSTRTRVTRLENLLSQTT